MQNQKPEFCSTLPRKIGEVALDGLKMLPELIPAVALSLPSAGLTFLGTMNIDLSQIKTREDLIHAIDKVLNAPNGEELYQKAKVDGIISGTVNTAVNLVYFLGNLKKIGITFKDLGTILLNLVASPVTGLATCLKYKKDWRLISTDHIDSKDLTINSISTIIALFPGITYLAIGWQTFHFSLPLAYYGAAANLGSYITTRKDGTYTVMNDGTRALSGSCGGTKSNARFLDDMAEKLRHLKASEWGLKISSEDYVLALKSSLKNELIDDSPMEDNTVYLSVDKTWWGTEGTTYKDYWTGSKDRLCYKTNEMQKVDYIYLKITYSKEFYTAIKNIIAKVNSSKLNEISDKDKQVLLKELFQRKHLGLKNLSRGIGAYLSDMEKSLNKDVENIETNGFKVETNKFSQYGTYFLYSVGGLLALAALPVWPAVASETLKGFAILTGSGWFTMDNLQGAAQIVFSMIAALPTPFFFGRSIFYATLELTKLLYNIGDSFDKGPGRAAKGVFAALSVIPLAYCCYVSGAGMYDVIKSSLDSKYLDWLGNFIQTSVFQSIFENCGYLGAALINFLSCMKILNSKLLKHQLPENAVQFNKEFQLSQNDIYEIITNRKELINVSTIRETGKSRTSEYNLNNFSDMDDSRDSRQFHFEEKQNKKETYEIIKISKNSNGWFSSTSKQNEHTRLIGDINEQQTNKNSLINSIPEEDNKSDVVIVENINNSSINGDEPSPDDCYNRVCACNIF